MSLPKQTGEIFEALSKGQFICSNSGDESTRKLYDVIEENFDTLYDFYNAINFILESGDEYYYFARKEIKAELERKLEIAYKWIDILDFFKTYDNAFGSGYRFNPADILVRVNVDAVLKNKLEGLKKYTREDNYSSSMNRVIEMLLRDNFLETENEISNDYKVLASFKYMEELVLTIHIPDEVQNEIPE
jgi:hypothetical protein